MYVIMTKVKLRAGTSAQCADLFRNTNPAIVEGEKDWLGAQMLFDRETDIVTVLATWSDAESYRRMSGSEKFKDTMSKFSAFFAAAPEITVNEMLVQMSR